MKSIVGILLLTLVWILPSTLLAQQEAPAAVSAAEEAEWVKIRQIKNIYEEVATSGKVEILEPYISKDFTAATLTGEELVGFSGLAAFNTKIREMLGAGATHQMKIEYAPGAMFGDLAIAHGSTQEEVVTSKNNRFNYKSLWSAVLRRENGAWKLLRVHQSIDPVTNEFVKTFETRKVTLYGGIAATVGILIGLLLGRATKKSS